MWLRRRMGIRGRLAALMRAKPMMGWTRMEQPAMLSTLLTRRRLPRLPTSTPRASAARCAGSRRSPRPGRRHRCWTTVTSRRTAWRSIRSSQIPCPTHRWWFRMTARRRRRQAAGRKANPKGPKARAKPCAHRCRGARRRARRVRRCRRRPWRLRGWRRGRRRCVRRSWTTGRSGGRKWAAPDEEGRRGRSHTLANQERL
mmetsp:Transcript_72593/g.193974  ORF Transcript_72593/g.193974 Transcript_72593/m.193974 type:complete len:200 (-) Transcript_72593:59-658(-)